MGGPAPPRRPARARRRRRLAPIDRSESVVTALLVVVCALPLALTVWALLDAARRPEWAWALAGRRRVVWMAAILFGAMALVVGLVVSVIYLVRVRPEVEAAESGVPLTRSWSSGRGGPNSPTGGGP